MITITNKNDFKKSTEYFARIKNRNAIKIIELYAKKGLEALKEATPLDSGKTRDSWYYEINQNENVIQVVYKNSNRNDGVNIAIILQYGHGTRSGTFIQGIDYINPAIKPIFQELKQELRKEVS